MKKHFIVVLVLILIFTPLILIHSLGNHEKLRAKITRETGYPYVFIEEYTFQGRSFTAYTSNPTTPHIPEIIWVEGYVGWFGGVHITKIIDFEELH